MSGALLSAREAAVYLGRSLEWTRGLMADGSIAGAHQRRGRWYVARVDLDAWMAAGSPEAEREPVVHMPRRVRPLGVRRAS